jgi:lipoyl(octanoyl) transferase
MASAAYLLNLGETPYLDAWELQRSLAGAVSQGAIPDTILLLEHPPVITLGRRAETNELHVPADAAVEVVETDRGGKSTYHGPGQLIAYPILDLNRHGRDVKKYCRDLEEAVIQTVAPFGVDATRIDGLTGVWLQSPPRKICSIGVHISRWITTHGYALNVDLDPAPFTDWITACGLEDAAFTTIARELGRQISVDEIRPHAASALAEVFKLKLEELPAEGVGGLWPQPLHAKLAATRQQRRAGRRPTRAARTSPSRRPPRGGRTGFRCSAAARRPLRREEEPLGTGGRSSSR